MLFFIISCIKISAHIGGFNQFLITKKPVYGFDINGTYKIEVNHLNSRMKNISIALVTKEEYLKISYEFMPIVEKTLDACFEIIKSNCRYLTNIGSISGNYSETKTIDRRGIYYIFFYTPQIYRHVRFNQEYDVVFTMWNNKSRLGYQESPLIIEQPICFALVSILLIVNGYMAFKYRRHWNWNSLGLLVALGMAIVYHILFAVEMFHLNNNDQKPLVSSIKYFFIAYRIIVLAHIIAISKGYFIINNNINIKDLQSPLIISATYFISCLIIDLNLVKNTSQYEMLLSFTFITFLIIYISIGLFSFVGVIIQLNDQQGSNPEDTSLNESIKKYLYMVTAYFLLYFCIIFAEYINYLSGISAWVFEFYHDIFFISIFIIWAGMLWKEAYQEPTERERELLNIEEV